MIHFGANQGPQNLVWGQRTAGSLPADAAIASTSVTHAYPMTGQGLGGVGMFRTASGQPVSAALSGAYLFDNYVSSYLHAGGQYSFALQILITLTETLNLHGTNAANAVYPLNLNEQLNMAQTLAAGNHVILDLVEQLRLRVLE